MKQEYISKTWLLQNTNTGMNVIELLQKIIDAPVVEFDTDELHRLRRITGRLRKSLEELME